MAPSGRLRIRTYGTTGPQVIVLHGGPAAAGSAAPLARGLAGAFRVLEPWQRGSGEEPLTVSRHVADLHAIVTSLGEGARPGLVGHSWGAMLALAYAAAHPESAGQIVLVGCGTFDKKARARMREIEEERTGDELRQRLARLAEECADPGERLRQRHELTRAIHAFDPIADAMEEQTEAIEEPFDDRAHSETWQDMLRLQESGVYPAAFAAIRSPVLMLHGAHDPHPGSLIRASLAPTVPQLEYHEWARCGHEPWIEKHVRADFFDVLRDWLARHTGASEGPSHPRPVRV